METVGGQAVIEGVMMRNKEHFAVAVRLKDGSIKVNKEQSSTFPKIYQKPFIRGVIGLFYALYDGLRALIWSSNQQLETDEQLSKWEIFSTIALSLLFSIFFFIIIPFFSAHYIHSTGFLFNILDGAFRLLIFLGYIYLISFMKEVKTLFQYHGAEHKTIYCHEAKQPLTVENVRTFSRFHPRCGTSFLFFIIILSIIVFSFIPGPMWMKLVGRIIFLPILAGIGYEFIRLSGTYINNPFIKLIVQPGLWVQRLTTKEPTDQQLEVGIASLKAVLKE